jgi:hypothetical protein
VLLLFLFSSTVMPHFIWAKSTFAERFSAALLSVHQQCLISSDTPTD